MKIKHLLYLAAPFIFGCATTLPPYKTTKLFDADRAKQDTQKGSNTIKGSALIRQQGGGVVTCAGQEVTAIPATAYADERVWVIYGAYQKGYRPIHAGTQTFENEPLEFRQLILKTTCDAQGFFKFENVADAAYYLTTRITWQAGNAPQGGWVMHKVNVWKGETKDVVITP